ncbi:Protein-L-isoaspartate O-methyltransferase [Alloactinosynnema sp. L-07]|uniref:methyltransferase domain-containing protein n=1 Tax=Alloactinosynnema sp. L-07 TaxID=1653480 RepID=UPI00065EF5DF|nr:methyltransferase domain-containing protein [Alloactinosynnema sp. L-07]CRK60672.1 Protein-L-isoaspartate O-methyltransferase [Alloactinosynnema sp. L-07]
MALARSLATRLTQAGDLRDPRWIEAFSATPRHVFVPRFRLGTDGPEYSADDVQRTAWLAEVYSDKPLTTQSKPHPDGLTTVDGLPFRIPTSSSTSPGLMARMLEMLDVRDGHRVLEIGTGTGYNAALLCHRVGAENVVSVDLDPDLVDLARRRLADFGYRPALVAGDGALGVAEHGPYDRIIATAAVADIPPAWIDQLSGSPKVVANLRGELSTGAVCVLARPDSSAELTGRFAALEGHFMWARPAVDNPLRPHQSPPSHRGSLVFHGRTALDPADLIGDDDFRFLLQLQLSGAESFYSTGETATLLTSDGSRAEVRMRPESDGRRPVVQYGPRRIWDTVEATAALSRDLGRLTLDRYGVTASRSARFVWLDGPDGAYRWPLPLV